MKTDIIVSYNKFTPKEPLTRLQNKAVTEDNSTNSTKHDSTSVTIVKATREFLLEFYKPDTGDPTEHTDAKSGENTTKHTKLVVV